MGFFFFKQKTAYEITRRDWSSDVCSSDLQQLYREHKGKIDESFAKLAFTTPPLAAYPSIDAKFTTTDMAKQLESHAVYGPPLGRTWESTDHDRRRFPDIRPLVTNPWTILHADAPAETKANGGKPID